LPSASITQIPGAPPVSARTERDVLAVRGFASRGKIPERRVALRQDGDTTLARVDTADLGAASGELGLEVAVEVVDIGALRLVFPGDPGIRQTSRGRGWSRRGSTRAGSIHRRASLDRRRFAANHIDLPLVSNPVLAPIRAPDADVGPVVPRVFGGSAVDVEDPAARPATSSCRSRGDPAARRRGPGFEPSAVAGPDLVTLRAPRGGTRPAYRRG